MFVCLCGRGNFRPLCEAPHRPSEAGMRGQKKCYNFGLASEYFRTAYCVSARRQPQYLVISGRSHLLTGYWQVRCLENRSYS